MVVTWGGRGDCLSFNRTDWSLSRGVGFQVQKEHALLRSLLEFMFVDILLAGVSHMTSPVPGGGEK